MKTPTRPDRPRTAVRALARPRPTAAAALLAGMVLSIPFVALALADLIF